MHIDDVRIQECPVSYITPETNETLSQVLHARNVYRACGASLFGSNLSEWPTWAVDAMSCIETEHVTVENRLIEARSRAPEED